jgi:hypothetical protein
MHPNLTHAVTQVHHQDLLRAARESCLDAAHWRRSAAARLVRSLEPKRLGARSPLPASTPAPHGA